VWPKWKGLRCPRVVKQLSLSTDRGVAGRSSQAWPCTGTSDEVDTLLEVSPAMCIRQTGLAVNERMALWASEEAL
jgi:hypothetical protein